MIVLSLVLLRDNLIIVDKTMYWTPVELYNASCIVVYSK